MVLPLALAVRVRPLGALPPSITITGAPAKSGSDQPSMTTRSVIGCRALVTSIVYGPGPAMSKRIVSIPGVLFVARIASRREMKPSSPLLASSAAMEVVSPSVTSFVVSTTNPSM